jgi:hypothetical protein
MAQNTIMDLNSYPMEYELLHECNGNEAWSQKILQKKISIFLRGLECVFSGVASTQREGGGIQFMVGSVMKES